jgi:hypothetical protein
MAFLDASEGRDPAQQMADMFGPGQVDQMIRQAIQLCWLSLPKERRTFAEVEQQFRRLVDRAVKDFRDDQQAFGHKGKA